MGDGKPGPLDLIAQEASACDKTDDCQTNRHNLLNKRQSNRVTSSTMLSASMREVSHEKLYVFLTGIQGWT
jgi:hypothetical protein